MSFLASSFRRFLRISIPGLVTLAVSPLSAEVRWADALRQPAAWYASDEAAAIADNVLVYQHSSGGWPKNTDMARPVTAETRAALGRREANLNRSALAPTIDNGATTSQIRFLASVFKASLHERHREAALRGLDYLLAAQYENGGWPQFFPLRTGYYSRITFNDDAMLRVLELLRDVAAAREPYAFIDDARRERAAEAVRRGIVCILRTQIVADGRPTAWAAQHDENTLAPAPARKFEPACYASHESAGLVRFLMTLENPSPEIVAAIQGAVVWFERTRLTGLRFERVNKPGSGDGIVTDDPAAPPIWARFYELGSERPIFIGRDGVTRYRLEEIERERRAGYAWYGDRPQEILEKFPKWTARHAPPSQPSSTASAPAGP